MTDDPGLQWCVSIVSSRYDGAYEGGKWLAIPREPAFVPEAIFDGDDVCERFFLDDDLAPIIGRGDTPNAALNDFHRRMQESAAGRDWLRGQGSPKPTSAAGESQ